MRRPLFSCFVFGTILIAMATTARSDTRPLATDRPDRTESPYSIPARWFQFEADLASHGRIEDDGAALTTTSALAFNAKYGLTQHMDVQVVFNPWLRSHLERPGLANEEDSGTGQAGLRVKYNLGGNDSEDSALALLPFALVPTRGDNPFDLITWGAMVPIGFRFDGGRTLSLMTGFTRVDNDETWVVGSMSLGTTIAGGLSGFLEVYVARGGFEENALDDVTFDTGLTYAAGPNWQFDAGVYLGATSNAEDWRVFAGASTRFSLSSR